MKRVAILGLLAAVGIGLTGTVAAPGQPAPSGFEAIASADGIRVNLLVPGAPLTANLFDGGAPVTQALVNSIGESTGISSTPYPGEAAVSVPALVLPLLGLPSPPDYPLMARSQAGTVPESKVENGAVTLTAKSDERMSEATSLSGGGDAGGNAVGRVATSAVARVDETGAVVAEAKTAAESFTAAGVFRIGAVTATATATRGPTGEPTKASTFSAEGVSMAGQAIAVTDKGIQLPGQLVPSPDTSGIAPVLDGAGITVTYVKSQETEDGIISAGLEVTVPGPNGGTVTYVFGRARASATSSGDASEVAPIDDVTFSDDFSTTDVGGSPDVSSGTPTGSSDGDVGFDAVPTGGTPLSSGTGAADLPSSTAGSPSAGSSPAGTATLPVGAVGPPDGSANAFYLVLVVGAVVALTGGALVRLIGVKLAWTS